MADFRIRVIVDPSGAVRGTRRVEQGLKRVEDRARKITTLLAQTLGFVGLAAGIREVIRLGDVLTNTENRLKLVTKSTEQLNAVTSELFEISARTRTGFDSTAKIFARTALSTKNLGLSMNDTLGFVESLNQAIVLSGVTAQEANAGLIQLSQGLASNTLRGDELRSVLEQLPAVADVIADHIGITRGELRLFGAEGRISAKTVIDAFEEAEEKLAEAFAKTVPTISQSFSVLQTRLIQFLGAVDDASGGTSILSAAILGLANNLELAADIMAVAASIMIGTLLGKAIIPTTTAVRALTAAILANPFGALAVAVGAAVIALIGFSDRIKIANDGLATLDDLATVVFQRIETAVANSADVFDTLISQVIILTNHFDDLFDFPDNPFADLELSLRGVVLASARSADALVNLWKGAVRSIAATFIGLPDIIDQIFESLPIRAEAAAIKLVNAINTQFNKLDEFFGLEPTKILDVPEIDEGVKIAFDQLGNTAGDAFFSALGGSPIEDFFKGIFDEAEDRARLLNLDVPLPDTGLDEKGEIDTRIPAALQKQLDLLEEERKFLLKTNSERKVQNELLRIEKTLRASNLSLNPEQRELLETSIKQTQALREQVEVLETIKGPQEDLHNNLKNTVLLFQSGRISADELSTALFNLGIEQANLNFEIGNASFADGFILGIERMLEAVRNFHGEAGLLFGDMFEGMAQGFADATADAIIFGDSFEEGIGNAARKVLADLLSGLIKLGIQYVLNAALANTLGTAATAVGTAQAAALGAAWATPAALASLASFGANAAPAAAGIVSTVALSEGLAIAGFADGGTVRGAGGPRADMIPAMLSNGEFVVNAKSAARFRPLLEQLNDPRAFQNGGLVSDKPQPNQPNPNANQGGDSRELKIINVLDQEIVGDYMSTPEGEDVIVNAIRRNGPAVRGALEGS